MEGKKLIKSFSNFEAKIKNRGKRNNPNSDILAPLNKFPNDPFWLKYCPPSYKEKARERISERILEEQRKQLFNSYSKPKLSGGGINKKVKSLIHDQPGTLTLEVQKLVVKRFQIVAFTFPQDFKV